MDGFADAIGLNPSWPSSEVKGSLVWADAYLRAADSLSEAAITEIGSAFYIGPAIQNAGIATELTLKALLQGAGASEQHLRQYSHNTYGAYLASRQSFDEVKFMNLSIRNTRHLALPTEVRDRLHSGGEADPDTKWRVYFDHLRLMDTVYDRPYRSRYIKPGPVTLPDTRIVLIGTSILLKAMQEVSG